MTKRCFYCNDILTEADFALDTATMIMPQTYAHIGCVDGLGDGSVPMRKCHYCWRTLSDGMLADGRAVKIGGHRYAHTDCIDSHGKENMMNDQTQHILGAADSAHQGIELARSLLQESLGNMGEILTHGCERLGAASLGSAMQLGQSIKEVRFILDDLLQAAHGLCVLLGKDPGVCEDKVTVLDPGPESPSDTSQYLWDVLGIEPDEPTPGEDEFDDNEQPF